MRHRSSVINWLVEHEATTGYRRQYRAYGAMGWPAGQKLQGGGLVGGPGGRSAAPGDPGWGEGP